VPDFLIGPGGGVVVAGAARPYGLPLGFTTGGRTGSGNLYGFWNVVGAGGPTARPGWPTICPGTGEGIAAEASGSSDQSFEDDSLTSQARQGTGAAASATVDVSRASCFTV
jgi:hypothetical protein